MLELWSSAVFALYNGDHTVAFLLGYLLPCLLKLLPRWCGVTMLSVHAQLFRAFTSRCAKRAKVAVLCAVLFTITIVILLYINIKGPGIVQSNLTIANSYVTWKYLHYIQYLYHTLTLGRKFRFTLLSLTIRLMCVCYFEVRMYISQLNSACNFVY